MTGCCEMDGGGGGGIIFCLVLLIRYRLYLAPLAEWIEVANMTGGWNVTDR